MALSSADFQRTYTGSAFQRKFDFDIPYFEASDITVLRVASGVSTYLSRSTAPANANQFSVTATNNDTSKGATITLGGDATVNATYTISRTVPYTQLYDLQEGSSIDPTSLNKSLDRLAAQNQQQVMSDYSGQQSVTFPNGLIMKFGTATLTSSSPKLITFDASFPNAIISAQATPQVSADDADLVVQIDGAPLNTQMVINAEGANNLQKIHWLAFGH